MSIFLNIIGLLVYVPLCIILGNLITNEWFVKKPNMIVYAVDITLRGVNETMDEFIKRVMKEGLGRYVIV